MKKVIFFSSICLVLSVSSCGSSWEFKGNNVNVSVASQDTIVPKGTVILQVDSMK